MAATWAPIDLLLHMTHADFVHLRVHTAYSLSEGALKIEDLAALCRDERMPAVAITDSGNLFGAMEFALACAGAGVQPIIGCQISVRRTDGGGRSGHELPPDVLVLLAQNDAGYHNLLKLVSRAFLETEGTETPQVDLAALQAHADGLIALTGGVAGAVGRLLGEGQGPAAAEMLGTLNRLFPSRLYVEITRHGLEIERRIEAGLIELADAHGLPLVATNEAFFGDESMFHAHDALICIAESSYVEERERRRLTPEHRFKTAAEMRALFADLPEAVDNTLVIARRCAVMPEPRPPILPAFAAESGRGEVEELKAQAAAGLEKRLGKHVFTTSMDEAAHAAAAAPYRERLDYEIGVIAEMGFCGYFLIVADFIQWAKEQNIPVGPGRGSGAGSVVAWALTITDLDPLRWGLLFERFLNPERVSMPDFDIDFCQDRRDEVIQYVQNKYGFDRVAQIITFGKLQARAVLRDVGRVLHMPYGQVDRICKLVPNNPASPVTLQQAIDGEPLLRDMRRDDPMVARLMDIALKLEGLYRHASTHAAGVVIGDRPLDELVPLYRDPRSPMPVTQFNMKNVERAGLVKFDFLGLKTLTVLARAAELLAARGIAIDFETLPLDDPATYEMLGRGESTGVFQLEGAGMRDVLRQLRPDRFEDIIAVVALYRPGPMENIPSYIARKHGDEQTDNLHPSLEATLAETYGIIIYQEQVMQIAQVLSGYSLGRADVLRRAMGKKDKAVMEAEREAFVDGAVANNVARGTADGIFDLVYKFAGYGFNKSHAAAYALVAYQTAYLKANHPVEFMAASMTLDLGNTDKINVFKRELERLAIPLLPPDINASAATFTVEPREDGGGAIRYALAALKNVGRQAMLALTAERSANGPFSDLFEFARRFDSGVVNRRQLESLACAGAFDGLNRNRRQVYEAVDSILAHASAAVSERESNQENLFGDGAEAAGVAFNLPDVPDWPMMDRLRQEFDAVGFYLTAHPLDAYDRALARIGVVSYAGLCQRLGEAGTATVRLAGTVISRKERSSQRGNRYAFVQLSDSSGMYEVTVFSEVLAGGREILDKSLEFGLPVLMTAEARAENGALRVTVQELRSLDDAVADTAQGLKVFLAGEAGEAGLAALSSLIARQRAGRGKLSVIIDLDDREVEVAIPGGFAVSPATRAAIKAIPGVAQVDEL